MMHTTFRFQLVIRVPVASTRTLAAQNKVKNILVI